MRRLGDPLAFAEEIPAVLPPDSVADWGSEHTLAADGLDGRGAAGPVCFLYSTCVVTSSEIIEGRTRDIARSTRFALSLSESLRATADTGRQASKGRMFDVGEELR